MNFNTMHKQRKMILIAAAIGLLGTFLPWLTVSLFGISQSANGWNGVGFLAIIGFILAGVMAFMGDQNLALKSNSWFLALGGGALALLGIIIFWSRLASVPMAGAGFGLYISLLAAIGVVALGWMNREPGATLRDGFDAVKRDVNNRTNTPTNI